MTSYSTKLVSDDEQHAAFTNDSSGGQTQSSNSVQLVVSGASNYHGSTDGYYYASPNGYSCAHDTLSLNDDQGTAT